MRLCCMTFSRATWTKIPVHPLLGTYKRLKRRFHPSSAWEVNPWVYWVKAYLQEHGRFKGSWINEESAQHGWSVMNTAFPQFSEHLIGSSPGVCSPQQVLTAYFNGGEGPHESCDFLSFRTLVSLPCLVNFIGFLSLMNSTPPQERMFNLKAIVAQPINFDLIRTLYHPF